MTIEPSPVAPHEPLAAPSPRTRRPGLSLLWWAFLANALVLATGTLALIVTPITITAPVATVAEVGILLSGLTAMLVVNLVLLRRMLLPLRRLTALMGTIDPMSPGRRLDASGGHLAEVGELADAFNAMLDRLEHERQESARRVLDAQEGERLRIARELHDELGQTLTATAIDAERAADGDAADRAQALYTVAAGIRATLDDVRRIARELRPEALDDLGLTNALLALCRRVSDQSPVRVVARIARPLPPMSKAVELVIYRVTQESLTNAIRHAGAHHIDVTLRPSDDGRLELRIHDDGHGLPDPIPAGGTGIAGMRERAMLVGGRLLVGSRAGEGTDVVLEVPPQPVRWSSR